MIITIFWALVSGSTYMACYKEGALAQVCVSPSGSGKHDFSGLKYDTDYVFTYKENGVESSPLAFHTPQKKTPVAPGIVVQN